MQEFPLNIPLSMHNNVQTTNVNPTNPLKLDLFKMSIINIFGNNDIVIRYQNSKDSKDT